MIQGILTFAIVVAAVVFCLGFILGRYYDDFREAIRIRKRRTAARRSRHAYRSSIDNRIHFQVIEDQLS